MIKKFAVGLLMVGLFSSVCYAEAGLLDESSTELVGDVMDGGIIDPEASQEISQDLDVNQLDDKSEDVITNDDIIASIEKELGKSIEDYISEVNEAEFSEREPMEIILKTDKVSFYANNIVKTPGIGVTLYYELVNNSDDPVIFLADGISVNGFTIDNGWVDSLDAKNHTSGLFVIAESDYKPFGIATNDVKDIEFYLGIFYASGSSYNLIVGDYVQSHENPEDWTVGFEGDLDGTVVFDTPEITIKVLGQVEDNAISQRFVYQNHTEDKLKIEMPLVKYNNKVREADVYAVIPPKKAGCKDVIWEQEAIDGVSSVITNVKVYNMSEEAEGEGEKILLDKNIEIVLK